MSMQDGIAKSDRRQFLSTAAGAAVGLGLLPAGAAVPALARAATPDRPPVIDTHMHVWSGDPQRFPFEHPYQPDFQPPPIAATVELLLEEMDRFGIGYCVLVQTIYHGWDNRYLVHCLKA